MAGYVASSFSIQCKCGHVVMIRTAEHEHSEPCWKCPRQIKIIMGYGKNNYRCYIVEPGKAESQVKPRHVDQGK